MSWLIRIWAAFQIILCICQSSYGANEDSVNEDSNEQNKKKLCQKALAHQHLINKKSKIIREWKSLASQQSPELILEHKLSEMLDSLAKSIKEKQVDPFSLTSLAPEYSPDKVVSEYQKLRRIVFSYLDQEQSLARTEREVLLEWFDTAILESTQVLQKNVEEKNKRAEKLRLDIAMFAHDLRTPLSAAKIGASLFFSDAPFEKRQAVAARIVSNIDRVSKMLTDLVDAVRLERGEKIPLELEFFEAQKFIRETIEDLATIYGDRFILSLKPQHGTYVFWCKVSMRRVIENLIGNAVKYGKEGQVGITFFSNGELRLKKDWTEISVHNDGYIHKSELPFLFELFHRTKKARESGGEGFGIGLPIVRGQIVAHGGKVFVKSDKAKGTTFIIQLPTDARAFQR